MKPLLPDEVRRAVHGIWLTRGPASKIDGVSIDSRTAKPGDIFIAIKGPKYDGHDYLEAAAEAGCLAAVVRRKPAISRKLLAKFELGTVGVEDTVAALGELSAFYRTAVSAAVIAVTGSNGKTTVKRMIHHILSRRMPGSCGQRSFNNSIGVPLTLFDIEPGDDYVVCEIGTDGPGQVGSLSRIARPNVAVVTNVGPSHLAGFGDLDRIAMEKASIFIGLADRGMAVFNADSEQLTRSMQAYNCLKVSFGLCDGANIRLTGYTPMGTSQRFEINGRFCVDMSVPGKHNAVNALAAIAVAQRFGFERVDAASALADFSGAPTRLEFIELGKITLINDAYNSNPSSLQAAAEVLGDYQARRKVMVCGDMLELGQDAESLHVQAGKDIARSGVDLLIGVGPLGRYIAQGAAEAGMETEQFASIRAAMGSLPQLLKNGDAVLIKASHAVKIERIMKPIRAAFSPAPKRRKKAKAKKGKKT